MSIESNISNESRQNNEPLLDIIKTLKDDQSTYDTLDVFERYTWGNARVDELAPLLEETPIHISVTVPGVGIQFFGDEKLYRYKNPDGSPVVVNGYIAHVANARINSTDGFTLALFEPQMTFIGPNPNELPEFIVLVPVKNILDHEYLPV